MIGDSPRAAHYAGMRTRRKVLAVMGLSGAVAGVVLAVGGSWSLLRWPYLLAFAIAQLPVGVFLDRYGPRRVMACLLCVAGCGNVYLRGDGLTAAETSTMDAYQAVLLAIAMGGAGTLEGTVTDAVTGLPVEGAKVTAEVVGDGKEKKIYVFKFKRRKGYRRKTGHRQKFTEVLITDVKVG